MSINPAAENAGRQRQHITGSTYRRGFDKRKHAIRPFGVSMKEVVPMVSLMLVRRVVVLLSVEDWVTLLDWVS